MSLDVAVCLKVVPKPEEVTFNRETRTLDRTKAENVLNPPDKNALEVALQLKDRHGGTVSVVSMGPPLAKAHLELCLGMGADRAILASDRLFAGADTYPTSLTLARAVQRLPRFDLVICGEESADAATGQVPQGIAAWLDLPQVTAVDELRVEGGQALARRALGGGYEVVAAPLPALVAVMAGCNQPRFPDFRKVDEAAAAKKVEVLGAAQLGLTDQQVGLAGSYTIVSGLVEGERAQRKRQMLQGPARAQAKALAKLLAPHLRSR